jgi:hypothetical protein
MTEWTLEAVVIMAVVFAVIFTTLIIVRAFYRRLPKRLKVANYQTAWAALQARCKFKDQWAKVVLDADELLSQALTDRKIKGKSVGEKIVAAQRQFSDNDAVWTAHNLAKKIRHNPEFRVKESDIKRALVGFRQALRDLGALPNGK